MVIKCVISGRLRNERYVHNINANQPDFVVRPTNYDTRGIKAPIVRSETSKTGDLRMTALMYFVTHYSGDDLLLMVDDDDFIVTGDHHGEVSCHYCGGPEVDAVWCWLISQSDAGRILRGCEGRLSCCEAEDLIILSYLSTAEHVDVDDFKITRDVVDNLHRLERRESTNNAVDFIHNFWKFNLEAVDLFEQYVKIPLLSGVFRRLDSLDLSDGEIMSFLHMLGNMPKFSPSLHNFLLEILRKSNARLVLPFEDFNGYQIIRGKALSLYCNREIRVVRIFSKGYEKFLHFHNLNQFLFRLRNPRTENVQFINVWNGPEHPAGFDKYTNTSLADCRRIVLRDIDDKVLVQWVDGDDQVDCESLLRVADLGEQLVNTVCETSAGNRTPCMITLTHTTPVPRWDGCNPHWTGLLEAKTFKQIQKSVDTLIKAQTKDMPYVVERGAFYNEDVFHAMFRHTIEFKGSEPVIYRFSAGSTNCKRQFSFDRWINLFGAGLWTIAKMGAPEVAERHFMYSVNTDSFGKDTYKVMQFQEALHRAVPEFRITPLEHEITKYNKPYEIVDLSGLKIDESKCFYHWTW